MRRADLKAPQAPKPISIAATQSSMRGNSRSLSSKSRSGEISTGCLETAQAGSTKTSSITGRLGAPHSHIRRADGTRLLASPRKVLYDPALRDVAAALMHQCAVSPRAGVTWLGPLAAFAEFGTEGYPLRLLGGD